VRNWAETAARRYLEECGYATLAENYYTRRGELDLVMRDGGVTVFVEVRQRKDHRFGAPGETIDAQKLGRLRAVALHFLARTYGRDDVPARFDAVLITGSRGRYRLEHLKDIPLGD